MEAAVNPDSKNSWLHKPVTPLFPGVTVEHLLVTLIIIAAVISRFYAVGLRVMSHDEVNHVVPSYELYQGRGYAHDPVTHGPLQFHLLAASYFLMGDSDFASRVPAALFSIAAVVFVLFAFRRYLGRTGALLAGLFFLVSPYMLFYGRYTRNEAFVALFGLVMLYAVLRYLETGRHNILYLFTIVLALHFATKETAFIYTAQLLIFLAVLFLRDVIRKRWAVPARRDMFLYAMVGVLLFLAIALGAAIMYSDLAAADPPPAQTETYHILMLASLGLVLAGLVLAAVVLIRSLRGIRTTLPRFVIISATTTSQPVWRMPVTRSMAARSASLKRLNTLTNSILRITSISAWSRPSPTARVAGSSLKQNGRVMAPS